MKTVKAVRRPGARRTAPEPVMAHPRLCPYCRSELRQDHPTWRRLTDAMRRLFWMRDALYRKALNLPTSGAKQRTL